VPRAALLLAALLLAACAQPGSGATDDVRGEWQLAEGSLDGADLLLPPGGGATLLLEDVEASGRSFCNHYGGTYRVDGDAIAFENLGGTEMACAPDVMAAESAYLRALGSVGTVAVEGDVLVLTGNGVRLTFRPVPPTPTSELADTRWVLETLIEGETASSTLGDPAVLLLDPEGTAEASTGCRSITGRWLVENGALVIDDLIASGECGPDVERQDAHVTAVLQSGPAVEIEEDRLTLTDAMTGLGLVYRAES
jgi:heat shock protein HslJ